MTKTNVAIALVIITALVAIGAPQPGAQSQQGQVGRYQLLSAQHTSIAEDIDHKIDVTKENDLFKIDTVTGETYILGNVGENGRMTMRWVPVEKVSAGK